MGNPSSAWENSDKCGLLFRIEFPRRSNGDGVIGALTKPPMAWKILALVALVMGKWYPIAIRRRRDGYGWCWFRALACVDL